jgi:AraC-like DNA-binding protein
MDFALHHFAPPLGRFVESLTFFAGVMPLHAREKLLPDGAIEIVVDLTDTPKKLYSGEREPGFVDYRQAWISGMHRRPMVIEAQQLASMAVIRFRPGGAYPFLRHAADALTDDVIPLDAVFGPAAASLRDRLLEAPDMAARVDAAEDWLLRLAGGMPEVDPLVVHLTRRLQRPGGVRISALAEDTGYSERQLLNLFKRWVGVGPKQYARIRRFQQVLDALCQHGAVDVELGGGPLPSPDWADLAAATGYADQAHFSHEFSAFAGMTPSAYVAAYRGLSNYLPIMAQ